MSAAAPDTSLDRARAWLADDPDPDTRHRARPAARRRGQRRRGRGRRAARTRSTGRLEFGTAGLRGALGPGPNRMNRVVVTRAAAGLAAYLPRRRRHRRRSVVIGYDARHKSDVFARDTAEVMDGAGLHALVLPRPLPTPVLAFAIRHLGARGRRHGHREPQPAAGQRLQGLPRRRHARSCRRPTPRSPRASPPSAPVARPAARRRLGARSTTTCSTAYLDDRRRARARRRAARRRDRLHADARRRRRRRAARARRPPASPRRASSPRSSQPDPDFPTVSFPNPEEPGAMDLALEDGLESDADVVIANDPDADRCAVAVPRATAARTAGRRTHAARRRGGLAARLVDCTRAARRRRLRQLDRVVVAAGEDGRRVRRSSTHETLTGFKWIGRVPGLAFGYEEALGYCVDPEHVRDKDGVTAALRVVELVAALQGRRAAPCSTCSTTSPCAHGLHATDQLSVRVDDLARHRAARWPGCAAAPPTVGRRARGRARSTTSRTAPTACRRPTACACSLAERHPRRRPPERHRAQAQVLPRGRRPGDERRRTGCRRRRGRAPRRRAPARRAQGGHGRGAGAVTRPRESSRSRCARRARRHNVGTLARRRPRRSRTA